MKKIIASIIIILMFTSLCGCSDTDEVYTETQGNLLITYIYDNDGGDIISKSVYNNSTEITIIYTYYYDNHGWGKNIVGSSIVSVDKDGKIIGKFEIK